MVRVLVGIAVVLIGFWLFMTVLHAVSAVVHLALVVAVVLVVIGLLSALRQRARGN